MSDDTRQDRHPTDEPDGTPAHEASLRPVGHSVSGGEADDDRDAPDPAAAFGDTVPPGASRAGYDVDAVSGDTEAVRPQ